MGFTDLFKKIFGTKAERDLKQLRPMLDKVLAAYETIDKLTSLGMQVAKVSNAGATFHPWVRKIP